MIVLVVLDLDQETRGTRLIDYCEQHDLLISNTLFEVPERRRYTWKFPGDTKRFQIDYILIKKDFRKQVKSCHSHPGLSMDSDHNLVMAKCLLKYKKIINKPNEKKWCLEKLKEQVTETTFKKELDQRVKPGMKWNDVKSVITDVANKVLGKKQIRTKETLDDSRNPSTNRKT